MTDGIKLTIKNASALVAAIKERGDLVESAAVYGLSQVAFSVEAEAKKNFGPPHARGLGHQAWAGQGPNVVTGALRRSIRTELKARQGFGSYEAKVFPTMVYSRAVELGNPAWKSGVKYPYLSPAAATVRRRANKIFTDAVARKLRSA